MSLAPVVVPRRFLLSPRVSSPFCHFRLAFVSFQPKYLFFSFFQTTRSTLASLCYSTLRPLVRFIALVGQAKAHREKHVPKLGLGIADELIDGLITELITGDRARANTALKRMIISPGIAVDPSNFTPRYWITYPGLVPSLASANPAQNKRVAGSLSLVLAYGVSRGYFARIYSTRISRHTFVEIRTRGLARDDERGYTRRTSVPGRVKIIPGFFPRRRDTDEPIFPRAARKIRQRVARTPGYWNFRRLSRVDQRTSMKVQRIEVRRTA